MACIGRYRADDILLYLGIGHRLQITGSDRQFDPMRVIACTDYEQHLVMPCEPIQQAGEGAEGLVEWTIPDPDRLMTAMLGAGAGPSPSPNNWRTARWTRSTTSVSSGTDSSLFLQSRGSGRRIGRTYRGRDSGASPVARSPCTISEAIVVPWRRRSGG